MNTSKVCSKCHIEKPAADFTRRLDRPNGLYSCCKPCKGKSKSEQYRKKRAETPVEFWPTLSLGWITYRGKRQNIQVTVTKEDIAKEVEKCKGLCSYCGKVLVFNNTMSERFSSPSLDRIIPSIGYIPENIIVICFKCNAIKQDASADDLEAIAKAVRQVVEERCL